MGIKRSAVTAALALTAGNGLADVKPDMVQKAPDWFPASILQQQLIGRKPAKVGEFARFETMVRTPSEDPYKELPASPNQLRVIGKTPDKARP